METADLVAAARSGDRDAFARLVQHYSQMAFGYAVARLGDYHLAEDVTQEAFVSAYFSLRSLRDDSAFPGWLRGIVRNQCGRVARARRAVLVPLEEVGDLVESGTGPEDEAARDETRRSVLQAVMALPLPERQVTSLYYIGDHSQRDVATFLGLPVSTVNNRLHAARQLLKGGLLDMVRDDLQASRLPEDFPARIGRVIAQRGPIVDARFAAEHAPTPLDVIASEDAVSFAVIQQLGDGRVRCLALDPGQPIAAGAPLKATGELVEKPLSLDVLEAALGVLLQGRDSSEAIVETGIKALDLLCPLPSSGAMALYGPQGAGKIVVLGEIIHRLRSQDPALALLNFTQADTLKSIQFDDPLPVGGGKLDAVYLPVADAARPESASVAQTREAIQGTIYCSREMALESLYPAIDSFISSSRLLHPDRVGPRHAAIAEGVRARLSTGPEGRAQRLRLFLTQPFFTTEAYTNLPGEYVSLAQTLDGCEAILSGGVDDIPEDAFRFTGTLEQIRERASAM